MDFSHETDFPLYESVGKVNNKSMLCKQMAYHCPMLNGKNQKEVAALLEEKYDESKTYYFMPNYEFTDSKETAFCLWVNTGFKDYREQLVYAQFSKNLDGWGGAFAGTADDIIKNQIQRAKHPKEKKRLTKRLGEIKRKQREDLYENRLKTLALDSSEEIKETDETDTYALLPSISEDENITQEIQSGNRAKEERPSEDYLLDENLDYANVFDDEAPFYSAFYEKLLVKTGWSPSSIKSYLYNLVCRQNFLLQGNKGEEYIIRSRQSINGMYYAMINTALFNTLGNPIKLIIEFYRGGTPSAALHRNCKHWVVCDSKVTAIKYGFTKDDLNKDLAPVCFYDNDPNELVFSAGIDDFDLENEYRLGHCIIRKNERDGNSGLANLTDNQIYDDIVQAIRTAISINRYDTGYIRPMYNRKWNCIHFVIPYHVNGDYSKKPDLGIIVAAGNFGLWQVMTVLDYAAVKLNCNCLSPYRECSF